MTPDEIQKIERNKNIVGSVEDTHQAAMEGMMKDVHTCLPGIVQSFNPVNQTAEVQPAIQRVFTERGAVNLPLCVDVPVVFPGGGGFFFTFPISAGDECVLVFSERCMDGWAIDGAISEPEDYRSHDLSDAFAFVGVNSVAKKLSGFNASAAEIRNRAGTVKMVFSNAGIVVTGNFTVNGQVIANGKRIDETHKHSGVTTGGGQSGVVV
jgi:hypothetical protein